MYEVYLERGAERDLKKLSAEDYQHVIPYIKALAENPRPPGCRKIVSSKRDWRIRVGNYRVIYEIDEKAKIVRVIRVKRRPRAYR